MVKRIEESKELTVVQRGELVRGILELVDTSIRKNSAAPATQVIESFHPQTRDERNRIWKAIKYLEEKQQLILKEKAGERYVHLTSIGKTKLNEFAIWDITVCKPTRWDNKWRLVMFDLPASAQSQRHQFRAKLEDIGFEVYQRSVFIYPYECHDEIMAIARWFGLDRYIRYVVATEINDIETYRKLFDLD